MHHEQRQDVRQHRRRIRGARWARIKRSAGLGLLPAAVVGSVAAFAGGSIDGLKLPASFRDWYHVNTMVIDKGSPLFETMGGMHDVYVNSTGEPALKKGEPCPDKTVFLVDLHEFTISDGSYVEGPRKATAIMLKDKTKYASTGGWGFQAWAGGDPTKPLVTDPTKLLPMSPAEEGPRLRVFNLHPVSAR